MSATQKRVWPELVGKDADSAMKTLREESGFDNIQIVRIIHPLHSILTQLEFMFLLMKKILLQLIHVLAKNCAFSSFI